MVLKFFLFSIDKVLEKYFLKMGTLRIAEYRKG